MCLELNSWIGMAFLNLEKPPQEPTSLGYFHYTKWSSMVDS